ncbi:hypothetical protein JOC48_000426 [Aquibacillus albus]|uniref:Uncharacterized protein n=1 Tax=Aquibacillus albus TaxID=1168171 RepID=A0ABS2MVY5_9BACI|nr:hypothetical protein [Aquibacillus albus]
MSGDAGFTLTLAPFMRTESGFTLILASQVHIFV